MYSGLRSPSRRFHPLRLVASGSSVTQIGAWSKTSALISTGEQKATTNLRKERSEEGLSPFPSPPRSGVAFLVVFVVVRSALVEAALGLE